MGYRTFYNYVECYNTDEDGRMHGLFERFDDNGTLSVRCNFSHGKLHGEYTDYNSNGFITFRRMYRMGDLHGTCEWFDRHGDVYAATMYYNGDDLGIDPRYLSGEDKLYIMISGRRPCGL